MTTKHILSCAFSFMATAVFAQTAFNGESEYLYDEAVQLWRNTENASGLTLDSLRNRGFAEFSFQHEEGSYRRVQEGTKSNNLSFYTERYQSLGKYLYAYGKFKFNNGRVFDRAWSDVMRTYNSNPFITGSEIKGKYDNQDFDLTARIGTVDFNGVRLGIGFDYKVGDLSRLRDPRSRSLMLNYKLAPSVSYTSGAHTIGLAGWYNRYKEKIPNISTVQNTPNLYYYLMSGLEAVNGTVGGYSGYSREYVNHALGAEIEYGFKNGVVISLTSASIEHGNENMYEQYKREPGKYDAYTYKLNSQNRIATQGMIHQIDASAEFKQAFADEYRPELIIDIDPAHGYTSYSYKNLLTYKKRYQFTSCDINLHYRLNFTDGMAVKNYVGISGQLATVSQKHLLPTSTFKLNTLCLNAEYGQSLLANRRLWFTVEAGCHINNKAELNLSNETTPYAVNVLLPDMAYYKANYFKGAISLRYQFPLTIKNYRSLWYVKGYAQRIEAQHSMNASNFGITIGIFN